MTWKDNCRNEPHLHLVSTANLMLWILYGFNWNRYLQTINVPPSHYLCANNYTWIRTKGVKHTLPSQRSHNPVKRQYTDQHSPKAVQRILIVWCWQISQKISVEAPTGLRHTEQGLSVFNMLSVLWISMKHLFPICRNISLETAFLEVPNQKMLLWTNTCYAQQEFQTISIKHPFLSQH